MYDVTTANNNHDYLHHQNEGGDIIHARTCILVIHVPLKQLINYVHMYIMFM